MLGLSYSGSQSSVAKILITLEYQSLKSSLVVCLLVKAGKSLLEGGFLIFLLSCRRMCEMRRSWLLINVCWLLMKAATIGS